MEDRVVTEPTNLPRVGKNPPRPHPKPPLRRIKQEVDKVAITLVFPTVASFASPALRDWELDLNLQLTPSSDLHLNSWSEKERASFRTVISLLNEDQGRERICRNAWSFAEAFQLERKIQRSPIVDSLGIG
ncbi:hypothetical protein Chor_011651 [Crotalus horridus]